LNIHCGKRNFAFLNGNDLKPLISPGRKSWIVTEEVRSLAIAAGLIKSSSRNAAALSQRTAASTCKLRACYD
jgi:hypothetical protein